MNRIFYSLLVGVLIVSIFSALLPMYQANLVDAAIADWQKGASIVPASTTDFASDAFKQSVQRLKSTGANYVTLIIPYYQSNNNSTDIQAGWNTPTDSSIVSAISYVHSLGMKVMLKPHIETFGGEWRAFINPSDRATWYKNYGSLLNRLADIGKAQGVESICVGTELISMATFTSNSGNTQEWVKLINAVRARYSGLLTYSANWGERDFAEEVAHIGFWPQLDFIGISGYYRLTSDNSNSVSSLMASWDSWNKTRVKPLYDKYKKPILFTEVGYRSIDNAHSYPWDYSIGGNYNPQEQANDYEALFKYWSNYAYFAGVQLWQWNVNPGAGGSGDRDYTPQNKPAEQIMRTYWGGTSEPTNPTPGQVVAPQVTPFCDANTSKVRIAWNDAGKGSQGYYADLDNDGNWNNGLWNVKLPSATTEISGPQGFGNYAGSQGALTLTAGKTYSARVYYIAAGVHSPVATFVAENCENIPPTPPTTPGQIVAPQVTAFCDANTSKVRITWNSANQGSQGYYADIDNDGNWNNGLWHLKLNSGTTQIEGPQGFANYAGSRGALTLTPGQQYSVRVYYIAPGKHSPVATFTASNCETTTPPTPITYATNIWWPTQGVSVLGVQPFKAMLEGIDVSEYTMFWQVDGNGLNEMGNSTEDYPHKESLVDVSTWNWRGEGPYNVTFISKDTSGRVISEKTFQLFVR